MTEWLLRGILGGGLRMIDGAVNAAPTLLVGLLIAVVLRYYFGSDGIRRVFGGDGLRSLPQSWLVGMLLPVCSIGVLPILVEMRRARVRAGSMSAFALSAPLFNPLSLLYGLTLSRPSVVLMFAGGSLIVVTAVGWLWDQYRGQQELGELGEPTPAVIGIPRLAAMSLYVSRQLAGPVGLWSLVGLSGLFLLAMVLPFASMQSAVERDDWVAPLKMMGVALPAYATPMMAMSQLGMMFQHANSPGAAFVLLTLGTGVNVATVLWLGRTFGGRSVAIWFAATVGIVVAIAYAINRPLVPPGVDPAGHTHAFDIYTNPFNSLGQVSWGTVLESVWGDLGLGEHLSLAALGLLLLSGLGARIAGWDESRLLAKFADGKTAEFAGGKTIEVPEGAEAAELPSDEGPPASGRLRDPVVPPQLVGATLLVGLVAASVAMSYAYYPDAEECLEEIRLARVETLSAARSGRKDHALYWLEVWEDWSRRLEVGTFLRHGEVRPYQRMQGYLVRKKLELLEHELEHEPYEREEVLRVVESLEATNRRWVNAFRDRE